MFSRRNLMQAPFLAACDGLLRLESAYALAGGAHPANMQDEDFTRYVNVRMGTGKHGHTSSGATVPFGPSSSAPTPKRRDGTGAWATANPTLPWWAPATCF